MHKGRSSEFFQGGVELMNKPGLQGDKEVMTMIQESLPGISLKNILLELGSAKFYNRLLELVGNQRNELEDILRLRDISEMKRFISKNDFEESLNQLLLSLPTCFGNIDLLHQMMDKCQDSVLLGALQELKDLYESLDSKEGIIFDLGMVPTCLLYTAVIENQFITVGEWNFGSAISVIMAFVMMAIMYLVRYVEKRNSGNRKEKKA